LVEVLFFGWSAFRSQSSSFWLSLCIIKITARKRPEVCWAIFRCRNEARIEDPEKVHTGLPIGEPWIPTTGARSSFKMPSPSGCPARHASFCGLSGAARDFLNGQANARNLGAFGGLVNIGGSNGQQANI
jgi:hypothetical protein